MCLRRARIQASFKKIESCPFGRRIAPKAIEPRGLETNRGITMKTTTTLGIILCMAGTASYAKDLDGKLIDASCYLTRSTSASDGQKPVKLDKIDKDCAPT